MRSTRSFLLLALTSLLAACGSYYNGQNYNGPNGNPGIDGGGSGAANLFVTVQFNGATETCQAVGVNELTVSIPNVPLMPGTIACDTGPASLEVFDLAAGSAEVTVTASINQFLRFTATQQVTLVPGANQLTMNLLPVLPDAGMEFDAGPVDSGSPVDSGMEPDSGMTPDSGMEPDSGMQPDSGMTPDGGESDAGTSFTATLLFGPSSSASNAQGMSCSEAGVQSVSVSIDSAAATVLPCPATNLATVETAPGTHSLAWSAFASTDGSGSALYSASESAQVVASGNANDFTAGFSGLVNGGFEVQWVFPSSGTCSSVGAATVTYDASDASGNELPGFPASSACGAGNFTVSATPGLTAGVYALVSMKAQNVSGTVVGSSGPMRLYAPAGQVATFTAVLAP